jgi:hypothetical protein
MAMVATKFAGKLYFSIQTVKINIKNASKCSGSVED